MATDVDYDEDIDTDDEPVDTADSGDRPSAKAQIGKAVDRWKGWPTWAKVASVPVGLWLGSGVIGWAVGGFTGSDDTSGSPASTTTTSVYTADTDPLSGLPALSPIAAASVKPTDRAEFANKVRAITADGTSICEVFFGVETVERDGRNVVTWGLTTPAMQSRAIGGVELPSATWPVRAFYGEPCNVIADDVPVTVPPTTVFVPPPVAIAPDPTTTVPVTVAEPGA